MDMSTKLPVCLLVLLIGVCIVACDDGQEQAIVAFPSHNQPLPTTSGTLGLTRTITVELVVDDGCLRGLGEIGANDNDQSSIPPSYLLVWPDGFAWWKAGGAIRISDRAGVFVAQTGDMVRFSGRLIDPSSDLAREIIDGIAAECVGPYYMVGDEVSAIGPDEPEVISIPGSALYFQRRKSYRLATGLVSTADMISPIPRELLLEGNCLLLSDQLSHSGRQMVVWPPGFYPHVGEDGVVEVRNGGNRTVARVGDRLLMRGVKSPAGEIPAQRCGVEFVWNVTEIRNADFPLVFLQHQQERDTSGRVRPDILEGEVVAQNGCLYIHGSILIWPSDFSMRGEFGSIEIIDEDGRIISRQEKSVVQGQDVILGEHVIVRGRSVKLDDDEGREILRTLPIDCLADSIFIVTE